MQAISFSDASPTVLSQLLRYKTFLSRWETGVRNF
jgi:hypothetical protein